MSDNLKFTVMPDLEGIGRMPSSIPSQPAPSQNGAPRAQSPKPLITGQIQQIHSQAAPAVGGSNRRRYLIIALAGVLLFGLAFAGFTFWQNKKSSSIANEPIAQCGVGETVPQGGALKCINTPAASEKKDTDKDGLTDTEEENLGTDPMIPDTDKDDLSDWDEVNIFKTSPVSIHSDADAFDDGTELKNGYNPTISGDNKLSQEELDVISAAYSKGELHAPTLFLLESSDFWKDKIFFTAPPTTETEESSQAPVQQTSQPVPPVQEASGDQFTYEDTTYGYQLILPGKWKKSGSNPTNLVFTEQSSPDARYLQIQSFVGIDPEGEISNAGLLENEIKRLAATALNGVNYFATKVSGINSAKLTVESRRESAGAGNPLLTATVEYIIDHTPEAFMVTISCTSDSGQSCMPRAQALGALIEQNSLIFKQE